MTRYLLIIAPLMMGCSALAQPPVPSLSPAHAEQADEPIVEASDEDDIDAEVREALASLDPRVTAEEDTEESGERITTLRGDGLNQGGLVFGETVPGSSVKLVTYGENDQITDSRAVEVDEFGNFLMGFDRDHGPDAVLMVTYLGETEADARPLSITSRTWRESSIQVEESKANPYRKEDLDKIKSDRELKNAARRTRSNDALWLTGFEWPADGCISSVFGSRRIVNGTPRRFHSGVDVAAPDGMVPTEYIGTEVRAPADGIIRLAAADMFFEGGLIFIDHGQGLYSYLMHLSSVDVNVGREVAKGDPIGKVGMTGRVTGPHLHWSLKWQDRLLDPAEVVQERAACTD